MLQLIHNNLYNSDKLAENILSLYENCENGEYYVFKRKMNDSGKYNAYLKTNGGIEKNSITLPALPKFLLPPEEIINLMEQSPKLNLKEGLTTTRINNWKDVIGDFFVKINDIEINDVQTNKSKGYLSYEDKFLKFMNNNSYGKKILDPFIYSIYLIKKTNTNVYSCVHLIDITMKQDFTYNEKSSQYSQKLRPYVVTINDNNEISSMF